LPLEKSAQAQKYLGGFRAYKCSEASSHGSKWKKELGPCSGLASKGLLNNDISYANNYTPGVCVMRQQSLPVIPPPAGQEARVRYLKKEIRKCEKQDAKARKNFEDEKAFRERAKHDPSAGSSSEVLPKHQRLTAGKPAICMSMPPTHEAMATMMRAEDSHFTSEYRRNGWWKMVPDDHKHELKEHVRPLDGWTLFRDRATQQNKCARFPINTY
jgi:hypothetical protein